VIRGLASVLSGRVLLPAACAGRLGSIVLADRHKQVPGWFQMAALRRDAATPIANAEAIKDCIRRNEHVAN